MEKTGVLELILAVALIALFVYAMIEGIRNSERAECIKWKQWEEQGYNDYYVTDWQVAQCKRYGIEFESSIHITRHI